MMKKSILNAIYLLLIWAILVVPVTAIAQDDEDNPSESANLQDQRLAPAIDHLIDLTKQDSTTRFDTAKIAPILEFIAAPKDLGESYSLGDRDGTSSDYYEFTFNRSLKEFLDLAYSPDIPSYMTVPSSVRRAHWIKVNGQQQPFPRLSDALDKLTDPVIIKGVEFNEITPDSQSGTYYAYTMDRTLILMKYLGRPMLISISNQAQKSNVGRKGLVLGADTNWDYLYTGEKGCMLSGLGWADSYMYKSASIVIYHETDGPNPKLNCSMFKWLRAGWAGMNLAKAHHIRKGVLRFSKSFKEVIESLRTPKRDKILTMVRQINNLPTSELREKVQIYFDDLKNRYESKNRKNKKWFAKLFSDEEYVETMTREEMTAIVNIEYLKYILGKSQRFDVTYFTPAKDTAKQPG